MDRRYQAARDVIEACDNRHCSALRRYIQRHPPTGEPPHYESIFGPLRCHADVGMALDVLTGWEIRGTLLWGAGDHIFGYDVEGRSVDGPIDPQEVYQDFLDGIIEIRPTIINPPTPEATDG